MEDEEAKLNSTIEQMVECFAKLQITTEEEVANNSSSPKKDNHGGSSDAASASNIHSYLLISL